MEFASVSLLGSQQYYSNLSPLIYSSLSFNHLSSSSLCLFPILLRFKLALRKPSLVAQLRPEERDHKTSDDNLKFTSSNVNTAIISSCLVGVLTGISVVLFNNGVDEIRNIFWDGIPNRGASWIREQPIQTMSARVILVPACGGLIVGLLNFLREYLLLDDGNIKSAARPFLKALAACVTLGTGNSLGPEGPSVDIGTSIAKGVGYVLDRSPQRKLSLIAAGSAAGIASGFNAAVAGCFFAVESVLWPSSSDLSLANTTSMVILSAVIASVVSEIGLGSEPAFKVPDYDFRSLSELPLYLLLGVLCGLVSLTLSKCTAYMLVIVDNLQKVLRVPKPVVPALGGLVVGTIALSYPEILYWGFENVDILLESRLFEKGLSAELLLQLVAVKIFATSLSRASGLVGGYYAPSLFIGASTGLAYGKFMTFAVAQSYPTFDLSVLEVASPQAYGLVGMAATLAGVCQVPLTSVLLLFELTQDYRIVLPLLVAVGCSSFITSGQTRRNDVKTTEKHSENVAPSANNLCEVESSLCIDASTNVPTASFQQNVFVSEAMRTQYVAVLMSTSLTQVVNLMLMEKQSCAMIVVDDNILIGMLTLTDIQEFSKKAKSKSTKLKGVLVSELCSSNDDTCEVIWTVTPTMDLISARTIMDEQRLNQVPVVLDHSDIDRRRVVGLLDRECIDVTYKALETREFLDSNDKDYILISDLTPNSRNCKLKCRLARVWESKNPRYQNVVISVDFLIVDEKGDTIQGFIRKQDGEWFKSMVNEGDVYFWTRFVVVPAKHSYRACENINMISVGIGTIIERKPDEIKSIPFSGFQFLTYDKLASRSFDNTFLSDVIGHLISAGAAYEVFMDNTYVRKRELELIDGENHKLAITLWNDVANQLDDEHVKELLTQGPIIIILAGVVVRNLNPKMHLTSKSSTRIYLNLVIPETNLFRQRLISPTDFTIMAPLETIATQMMKNRKTIDQLLKLDAGEEQDVKFTCEAVIKHIDTTNGWWYAACPTCKTKIQVSDDVHWCNRCSDNMDRAPIPWYKLEVVVEDDTGDASFIIFGHQAEKLIQLSASDLTKSHNTTDSFTLPPLLKRLYGMSRVFQLTLNQRYGRTATTSFKVAQIFEIDRDVESISSVSKQHSQDSIKSSCSDTEKSLSTYLKQPATRAKQSAIKIEEPVQKKPRTTPAISKDKGKSSNKQ